MNWLYLLVPACVKCRYYVPHRYADLARCGAQNRTVYAEAARADAAQCGLRGRWYNAVEPGNNIGW